MINPEVATKVVDFFSEMAQSNYDTSIHAQNVEEITEAEWEIIKLVGSGPLMLLSPKYSIPIK